MEDTFGGFASQIKIAGRGRRIVAFLIDHFFMTFIIVAMVSLSHGSNFWSNAIENKPSPLFISLIVTGFVIYFAKDGIKGMSLGKWVMGIAVRDENDLSEVPSLGRLILRNLLLVIWPIEVLVLATSSEKKRLGDKLCHTVVVVNPILPKIAPHIAVFIAMGFVFTGLFFFFVAAIMKSSDAYKIAVNEIEHHNEIVSETGGITGYGFIPSGRINITNGRGKAELQITVLGKSKNLDVYVELEKKPDSAWKITKFEE